MSRRVAAGPSFGSIIGRANFRADFAGLSQMVGARGFEPPAYGTQNRRATRLRHAPNLSRLLAGRDGKGKRLSRFLATRVHAASSASMIGPKSAALRLAPPTSAPSTSATPKIPAAFEGFTLPP